MFCHKWLNIIELAIIILTCINNVVSILLENFVFNEHLNIKYTNFIIILRLLRVPRVLNLLRIFANKQNCLNSSRYVTSNNKRRYQLDGYDLDLCYITDRLIAMSFPSSGLAVLYRNNISDVANFFNDRYGTKYKIYNLCEEEDYDTKIFNNQVERYMIADHNAPTLDEIMHFAKSSRDWLSKDHDNVIAVHCKGGKGRTGTMICVHLIDSEVFSNAELCLQYFGERRTDLLQGKKFQGVETPSQHRYIGYFDTIKKSLNYCIPEARKLMIEKIVIYGAQGLFSKDKIKVWIEIIRRVSGSEREIVMATVHCSDQNKCQVKYKQIGSCKIVEITPTDGPVLYKDIKLKFMSSKICVPTGSDKLSLSREQLDNAHKKSTWNIYNSRFKVNVYFVNAH